MAPMFAALLISMPLNDHFNNEDLFMLVSNEQYMFRSAPSFIYKSIVSFVDVDVVTAGADGLPS
jgi:hypothetical protein